jgi:hypothetical protein
MIYVVRSLGVVALLAGLVGLAAWLGYRLFCGPPGWMGVDVLVAASAAAALGLVVLALVSIRDAIRESILAAGRRDAPPQPSTEAEVPIAKKRDIRTSYLDIQERR